MPEANSARNDLPPHIEESVGSIARLHADHHHSATPRERAIERMTTTLGRANSIVALWRRRPGSARICWRGRSATGPLDPPPFAGLTGAVSVVSLFLVMLILASEQRADALAERREQLTLELAILSERKTAKVIELLPAYRPQNTSAENCRPLKSLP
jgi:hypothetical protein